MIELSVIGATGKLAVPIIKKLVEKGIKIRALVRDLEKAKSLLPEEVKIVYADLKDIESLQKGLKNAQYLYINLSSDGSTNGFNPEIHGIENILKAAKGSTLKQIIKISSIAALHPEFHHSQLKLPNNEARSLGHELLRASKIPYTIFHPTWFIESLEWFIEDHKFEVQGIHRNPIYWTNTIDFAYWIQSAMGNPDAYNKDFVVQGINSYTFKELAEQYKQNKDPKLKINEIPIHPDMKEMGRFMHFFEKWDEPFLARPLYNILGEPLITAKEYLQQL